MERLLVEHERQESFILDTPPSTLSVTVDQPIAEHPGTAIGPYKLLQQIGEGGMGVVFVAQQTSPLERTVALKIIKPGMDSRQVISRFEAERQSLAMMDHPNIAKVFDAGATDSGRPYFVMELVKGVPITTYCDEKHLTVRQRLELFVSVCQAVQHAHQKGIIHRDLKPSNVLVAEYDEHAVPKVIDFGIAKATAQKLTERTMFTEFGQLVGTMEYMSPEQAKLNQLDIDTRSDIYSLGVLLYELLTGSTPFEGKRLHEAAFDEMLRIVREEDPPKPSTRLSTTAQLPGVAANRGSEPQQLSGVVRGELDWIVMRALEKDRNRRYSTANAFALDVQRNLNDEAVQACPPSASYRFGKFARRNKFALFVASAAVATLLLLVVGLAVSNHMIAAERDQKSQVLAEKELALALAEAQAQMTYYKDALQYYHVSIGSKETEKMYYSVRHLLDTAANSTAVSFSPGEVAVRERIGHRQRDLAFMVRLAGRLDLSKEAFERSIRTFEKLKEQVPTRLDYWHFVADSHREVGRIAMDRNMLADAEREFRKAVELHEQRPKNLAREQKFLGEEAAAYLDLARLLVKTGRLNEATPLVSRGILIDPTNEGQADQLKVQVELANMLREAGKLEQALALYSEVNELATTLSSAEKFRLAEGYSKLARAFREMRQFEQAELAFRRAIALREPLAEKESPQLRLDQACDYNDMAFVLEPNSRWPEAERAVRASLALKQALVRDFPGNRDYPVHVAHSYLALGHIAVGAGQTAEAVQSYGEAAEILNKLATEPFRTDDFERFLGDAVSDLGKAWLNVDRSNDAKQAHQIAIGRARMLVVEFPDNIDYQLELAQSLVDGGEFADSLTQYAKILAGHPNLSDAWTGQAWTFLNLHQREDAIAAYSKAVALAPEVHTNWYHRGIAYLETEQWDKAVADFTKVVEAWPDEPGGWYLRAVAYTQLNQPERAIADLQQAIAKGYNDAEQLRTEQKLELLRSHADFKKLLGELAAEKK